jgi:hypothetical protein
VIKFQKEAGGDKGVNQWILNVGLSNGWVMGEVPIPECMAELEVGFKPV